MAENKDCDCLTQESQIDSIMEDETQLDANLEEDGELGSELENVVEVSKVYTGGETKDAIVHVDNENNIITTTLQKMWFSSFQEFPAVGSDNLIYADKGTGVLYTYNNETNSYDELISEPQITIDTEMSDTSENAVQNKVIKSYVDTEVNTINGEIDSLGNTVTDVENKINGINTSITTINGDISTIEGEIGQINSNITGIKGDLDGKASLGGDNVFSGKQTLNGEIEVNSGASFNRDVTLTDASLKILDNTTDTATTYKSNSIDIENNGGTKTTLTLPKKNGTILTDADINLKHSKIQNADTVPEKIDEIRIIDPEARFKITSQVENNQTELNVERNYMAMKHAGTSGSAEVSLSSNDAVIQSTDINGNVTKVTVTPTSAQLNGKDIVTTKGAEFEQRPTVKDNGNAVDVALKSDLDSYVPTQSENETHYSQANNQNGQFSVHISKNGETTNINNLIINKDGVFITGKVKLQGDADISGVVTVKETETLKVKDNIVITNADGVDLVDMSGLGIRKNSSDTYGIVYDPASDSVKLGLGKLDNSGKFTFNEGEGQPVAVRDDSSLFVDGHLVKWDATNHKFVDCGKDVSDSATANSIASRTAYGALKATPISDIDIENQTDNTVATKKDIKDDVKTTDLKNLSLSTTADGYWSYDSNTSKIKENGGSRTYTYNTQEETKVPSFSYLARATDIDAITNAHNNLADKVALKQDALTAGSNITITDNTISAKDTTYTAGENITISDDNVISAAGGTSIDIVQETGTSTTAVMSQDATTKELNTKLKTNTFNLYVGTTDACSNANGDFGQCSQIYNNDGTFYADRKFLFNKNDFVQEGQDAEKKYSLANDVVRTKDLANKQDKLTNSEFKQLDLDTPVDIWQATKADGGVGLISQDSATSLSVMNGLISAVTGNGETGFTADKASGSSFLSGGGSFLAIAKNSIKFDDKNVLTEDSITQSTGTATDKVMSQKTITDELNKKANLSNIPTQLSQLSEDETHRVVTDTEKDTWNAKSDFDGDYNSLTNKPTIPTKTSQLTNDSNYATVADIPSVVQSSGTSTTAVMSQKATTDALAKKMDNFSISIGSTNGGNPRQVKFMSINYTTATSDAGISIKLSMVSGHGNGSSYRFLQDAILGVTYTGIVSVDVYKYYNANVGTFDEASRNYGDIFYVKDETNKIVDFYVLLGQYSTMKVTPYFRLNSSTGGVITQLSGTPTYYSSGTKVYGNNSLYAKKSDIPNVTQTTGTSTENVMSQDAVTKELTAITTALSNKFSNHAQSAYDCNTCYDEGVYLIANGSNCPSGSQYGSLFVMPYRKPTGNAKPDFAVQIFIPNGDDGSKPNSMFYRTSLADSWNTWQEVATTAELNKKFNYGAQLSATDDLNNLTTGIYILNQDAGEEQHYPTGAYQDFSPVSIMHTEYGMVAYQVIFAGKNESTTSTGSPRLFLRYKQRLPFGIAWGTWQELNPATLALKSEIHEYVPDVVQSTGTSTAAIMSQNAVTTELNKKADLYKWTNINVTYNSSSTGTHTIDISSAISGWKSDAVYEVVWIMEAYCADVAYLQAYTDMFSNSYSDQRFSANGRQGGRIYTLPCHRYLYYNITTRALNPCKGAVVAYRRLY